MSQHCGRTNKNLFHASKLIGLAENVALELSESDRKSIYAGVSLCLKDALISWFAELAEFLNYRDRAFTSYEELVESQLNDFPDVQHLINLKQQPDTWLAKLIDHLNNCDNEISSKSRPGMGQEATLIGQISLVSVDEISEGELLGQIISEFKEYLSHVRSQHVEW